MTKKQKTIGRLLVVMVMIMTTGLWIFDCNARVPAVVEQKNIAAVGATQAAITSGSSQKVEDEEEIVLSWAKEVKHVKSGLKVTLTVENQGKELDGKLVTWKVNDKKIAIINKKGVLKAKGFGTVTVLASYEGHTISCKVKVAPKHIIGIDPGHQAQADGSLEPMGPGSSSKKAKVAGGTCGVSSRCPEYKFTLEISKKLKKELQARGYKVVMTRTKNEVKISNKERAEKINKSGADIYVRIHGDGGASSVRGASGLYPSAKNPYIAKLSKKSLKLTDCIMKHYAKETGITNRGNVQRDDLSGSNWSKVPVSLIELGFMTNATEDAYMQSADGQKKMVKGIADGIEEYYEK